MSPGRGGDRAQRECGSEGAELVASPLQGSAAWLGGSGVAFCVPGTRGKKDTDRKVGPTEAKLYLYSLFRACLKMLRVISHLFNGTVTEA